MKKLFVPAILVLLFLASQKSQKVNPKTILVQPTYDTIKDGGYFATHLTRADSIYQNTVVYFNHKAHLTALESDGDGGYFPGGGPINIYTISIDNHNLYTDYVPYTRGMVLREHIDVNQSGPVYIKLVDTKYIPLTVHVWCKDNYLKDSLDVTHGAHYNFNIDNTKPETYGDNRIQFVMWSDKTN